MRKYLASVMRENPNMSIREIDALGAEYLYEEIVANLNGSMGNMQEYADRFAEDVAEFRSAFNADAKSEAAAEVQPEGKANDKPGESVQVTDKGKENDTLGAEDATEINLAPGASKKISGYQDAENVLASVSQGESVSVDEIKAAYRYIADNETDIKAELSKLKNNELNKKLNFMDRGRYTKKADMVDAIYEDMLEDVYYAVSGKETLTTSFFGLGSNETQAQQVKRQIDEAFENLTDEKLKDILADKKKKHDAVMEKRAEMKRSFENPETLADFERKKRVTKLTDAEQERYDRLYADEQRKKRTQSRETAKNDKSAAANEFLTDTDKFTVEKTSHTKTGEDIWVVKPKERLDTEVWKQINTSMKSLGGSYWRGNGGWNFKTNPFENTADTKIEDAATDVQAKIRSIADNMQSAIDEKFKDRLTNTAKRAREAASAAEDGERLQRVQQTLRNIADAIERGEAELVTHIDSKTQIDTLNLLLNRAKRERISQTMKDKSYDEKRTEMQKSPTNDDVRYLEMPLSKLYVDTLSEFAKTAKGKDGYKLIAARLDKAVKSAKNNYAALTPSLVDDIDKVVKNLKPIHSDMWNDSKLEVGRLKRLGIESIEELRAYMREYITYLPGADEQAQRQKSIRQKEIELTNSKIEGFFPTPKNIVSQMLDVANIQPGDKVLEPSAGKGNIADVIKSNYPDNSLDVVEWNGGLAELLTDKGHNLVGNDFLETEGKYDKIVMNPPFEKGQDIDHVLHAYSLLNNGGRVVAIMSEGPFFRTDKKSTDFREWLDEVGGTSEKLPEGSFKNSERSTGVNTRLVVIDKSGEARFSVDESISPIKDISYNSLINKLGISITSVDDTQSYTRADARKLAKQNVKSKNNSNNVDGTYFVKNKDVGIDIIVGAEGINHGLVRKYENNAIVDTKIADYIENAIYINELKPRQEGTIRTYVLLGYGESKSAMYPAYFLINVRKDGKHELSEYGVLYSGNSKKIAGTLANKATVGDGANTNSTSAPAKISIADLLDIVKYQFSEILPTSVLNHYGIERKHGKLSGDIRFSTEETIDAFEIEGLADFMQMFDAYDNFLATYGFIKPGENPARDVLVPKKTSDKKYVSKFARTMMEAGVTPDDAVDEFKSAIVEGRMSHMQVGDKAAKKYARDKIDELGFDGAMDRWNSIADMRGIVDKYEIVFGMELYNQCINAKDVENAMRIAVDLTHIATKAGQAVQSFRVLKTMSPDGQLYCLEKTVQTLNRELQETLKNKASEIKIDEQLAREYLTADNAETKEAALDSLLENIAEQITATGLDKWNAWRYMSMLCNPRTHVRNVVGNAIFYPVRKIKNGIGAVLERKISVEERTKSLTKDSAAVAFAKEYAEKVKDDIKGNTGKYDIGFNGINEKRTIFKTHALEWLRKKNIAALEWEDWLFLKNAYIDSLSQIMTARGITAEFLNSGTKEAATALERLHQYAALEAQKATYRDANALADTLNEMRNRAMKKGGVGKVAWLTVGDGTMPFRSTPLNIGKRAVEYSPASIIKACTVDVRKLQTDENFTTADLIDDIAKGMTGSMLVALGMFLAHMGLINGGDDENKKKRKFDETTGWQGYSLNIGDYTYTIDWAAPTVLPLFVGVELMNACKKDGIAFKDIATVAAKLLDPMLELSVLQSVSSLVATAGYNQTGALSALFGDALTSYVGQAYPTIFGQVARTVDGTRRSTYIDKNSDMPVALDSFIQSLEAKVPFMSKRMEPRLDAWGREMSYGDNPLTRAVGNFVSPGYAREKDTSRVTRVLNNLYEKTNDSVVYPVVQGKTVTIDKVTHDLTASQYTWMAKKRGKLSLELVEELIYSSDFTSATDEEKLKMLKKCYDNAYKQAKSEFAERYGLE
ncbi:MAG: methyltransferase [Clostridia bacterium]|nr:methyltransferase [Clostridia bacterium]